MENTDIEIVESGDFAPIVECQLPPSTSSLFPAPPSRTNKQGLPIPPPQQSVADCITQGLEGLVLRDVVDPFHWVGTHWVAQNPKNFQWYVQNIAQSMRFGEATASELKSIYDLFMMRVGALPDHQTFYQQNPFLANFLDGTLEVKKGPDGSYTKEFREHRQEDMLTWVLPYEYMAPRPRNHLFEEWIARAFEHDRDGAGKVRALKQIGGACLVSLFPRIAILLSHQGGTGKSTFAKLCMKFMGKDNYSSVPPHLMKDFMMESMIGKQANIVTDIGKKGVIPEDFMKLVEDSLPILVNRKGRPAIHARIPALHLFCANALPSGIDGESTAMDRRVTIVEFTRSMLGEDGQSYTRDYEEVLMRAGSGAILDFFEDGLADLLASGGIYFNPDSGKGRLKEWKDAESLTAQIIDALEWGELGGLDSPLKKDPNGTIARPKLSAAINLLVGRTLDTRHLNRIFHELEARGFEQKTVNGKRLLSGIKEVGLYDF